ncbi:MAG: MFS transporter [Coriobacteriales bacterium]|nr:MFS transporter [Coriobacteriales bacterium]
MKELLRNRQFILYWLVGVSSLLAVIALEFAVSLYAFDLTGSALLFGSILAAVLVPRLLLTPFAGVISDRFNRKTIMLVSLAFSTVILMLGVLIQAVTAGMSLVVLFAFVLLLEAGSILFSSANAAVLPLIVEKDRLGAANSLCSVYSELSYVVGPLIGGIVYGLFGFAFSLLAVTISLVLSIVVLCFIALPKTPKTSHSQSRNKTSVFHDMKQGFSIIFSNRLLGYLLIAGPFLLNFFNVPIFDLILVFFVRGSLGVSPEGYGMFTALLAVGGVVCSLIAGKLYSDRRALAFVKVMPLLVAGGMLFILLTVNGTQFMPYAVLLGITFLACSVISAVVGLFGIAQNTIAQKNVDIDALSRVLSIKRLCALTAVPLGNLAFGAIVESVGLGFSVLISIIGIIGLFVLSRVLSPDEFTA